MKSYSTNHSSSCVMFTMHEVKLYLYDLSQGMARLMSYQLLGKQVDGVWHTGIVCFGIEYFFGRGIMSAPAGSAIPGMRYEVLLLGQTLRTKSDLEHYLISLENRFNENTYDLFHNNCNNFSNAVCNFLLDGLSIPQFILSLPREVLSTPLGASKIWNRHFNLL
jgi:desumoylating isopeptidase 1